MGLAKDKISSGIITFLPVSILSTAAAPVVTAKMPSSKVGKDGGGFSEKSSPKSVLSAPPWAPFAICSIGNSSGSALPKR